MVRYVPYGYRQRARRVNADRTVHRLGFPIYEEIPKPTDLKKRYAWGLGAEEKERIKYQLPKPEKISLRRRRVSY